MAIFPLDAKNGDQITTLSGVKYVYNLSEKSWLKRDSGDSGPVYVEPIPIPDYPYDFNSSVFTQAMNIFKEFGNDFSKFSEFVPSYSINDKLYALPTKDSVIDFNGSVFVQALNTFVEFSNNYSMFSEFVSSYPINDKLYTLPTKDSVIEFNSSLSSSAIQLTA